MLHSLLSLRFSLLSPILLCALAAQTAQLAGAENPTVADVEVRSKMESRERIASDLQYLSSDELKGRDTGSAEIDVAAQFIAERFSSLGLNTQLFNDAPYQVFTATTETVAGPAEKNRLVLQKAGVADQLIEMEKGLRPLAIGATGEVSGELVFAGYGITAPDAGYDDYAGLDVNGKVVVVIRGEPRRGRADNPLSSQGPSRFALFNAKVANAIEHGAVGLLIVNHAEATAQDIQGVQTRLTEQEKQVVEIDSKLASLPEEAVNTRSKLSETKSIAESQISALRTELQQAPEGLLGTTQAGEPEGDKRIPVASLGRRIFAAWVAGRGTTDASQSLDSIEAHIDATMTPMSFAFSGTNASLVSAVETRDVIGKNVIAELPGVGPLANETIVIGAHYDHVGMGGNGSLAPGTVAVHNGADDNGSGTVTMLELAHRLTREPMESRRRIVFMAFSGEELGLLGSKHYAREPRFPLETTVAMINLDMVGRLNDDEGLTIYGVESAPTFDGMIDEWNAIHKLPVVKDPSGNGPSDHTSFYEKGVPVLFFFTGLHPDYHRPTDDFEKINVEGMVRITDMVSQAAQYLATVAERPTYQKTGPGAGIRRGNRTAYLGVSMEEQGTTVSLTAVTEEGPAAKAGLQVGDTIVQIGDDGMNRIADVQRIISGKRAGDKITLLVLRNGQEMTVEVELLRRP
jgi:hypothetical protein